MPLKSVFFILIKFGVRRIYETFSQTQRILPSLWSWIWSGNNIDRQLFPSDSALVSLIQAGGAIPLAAAALASGPLNEQFQQLVDSFTGMCCYAVELVLTLTEKNTIKKLYVLTT